MERSNSSMRDGEWIVELKKDGENEIAPDWVRQVNNQLTKLPQTRSAESKRWEKQSIYGIPRSVKKLCSDAYQPQTVSIGPYHHGEPQLKRMEEHKKRALLIFLERSQTPLDSYLNALAPFVDDLKDAYQQLDPKWEVDTDAFVQLMIVDGCFVLELMRTTTGSAESSEQMGYERNDPVFSNHGRIYLVPFLRRDMIMLENQIPLLVLVILLAAQRQTHGLSKQDQLSVLILEFFSQKQDKRNIEEYGKCLHILDLYRRSQLLPEPKPKERCSPKEYIRSATELREAGIRFGFSKTCKLNDISFRGGQLKLPRITVDDELKTRYLNMIAFERFHMDAGNEVTSFAFFMDKIIDSGRDVELLQSFRGRIIRNALDSDQAVANLFNSLSNDVSLDADNSLGIVHMEVVDYCGKLLPRWMAYAKHHYFTNPWVGLSIVAAIFLFVLTSLQTVYTVLGYYHSS